MKGGLMKAVDKFEWIVLGIGGDDSNSSFATFFEGAVTSGRPADTTDDAVQANVIAAGYGM
jgi:non-reducing end alpha-L-arabinofuranosidase